MRTPKLYRVVPRPVRRWAFARLPAPARLRIVRRLVPLRAGNRVRHSRGRWFVLDQGQWLPAVRSENTMPVDAIQRNLDAVVSVLDAADIPYFRVRPNDALKTVVSVPLAHRAAVVALLSRDLEGFTVRWLAPRSRRRGVPESATVLQVFGPVTAGPSSMILGSRYACEVEFWPEREGRLHAPRQNALGASLPAAWAPVTADGSLFSSFSGPAAASRRYQTRREFARPGVDLVRFPIDVVYTWVDGGDPDWQQRKVAALAAWEQQDALSHLAANASRYINRDELRYSLRSLLCYAPWVRHIYLVTDDQIPAWLDTGHPRITVVPHWEIFGDTGTLPTFNSHAIESRLHRIPGLAEHVLYFNDDMFLGRPVLPTTFFHSNGVAKHFLSSATIGAGPASRSDAPVTAAAKNNRAIIEERHGQVLTRKLKHAPYPLRRSVLEEIESTCPEVVLATASHQFRHPDDVSIPSSLHHYWAFFTGRSVPGTISYAYVDMSDPRAPLALRRLLAGRRYEAFCLNDTETADVPHDEQLRMITEFLQAYFPFRAPFELDPATEQHRSRLTATALARRLATAPPPRRIIVHPSATVAPRLAQHG